MHVLILVSGIPMYVPIRGFAGAACTCLHALLIGVTDKDSLGCILLMGLNYNLS